MLLLGLLACPPPAATAWRAPGAELVVDRAEVAFAETALGESATVPLAVTNAGDGGATLTVTAAAPFSSDRSSVTLGAGETVTLALWFQPTVYGASAGSLTLATDDGELVVPLTGATDPDADDDGVEAAGAGGADCDDGDPAVHPGANDACYDDLDADCAADDDHDCDGDGVPVTADCDDADAAASPAHTADGGADGVDEDCDGLADEDLLVPGALVITEIHPDPPAWVEVCNAADRDVPYGGFTLATDATAVPLPAGTLAAGACAAWCRADVDGCAGAAALTIVHERDAVVLSAGDLVLDAVALDATWPWSAGITWSLGAGLGAADNDTPAAWCTTDGSPGAPNGACP